MSLLQNWSAKIISSVMIKQIELTQIGNKTIGSLLSQPICFKLIK